MGYKDSVVVFVKDFGFNSLGLGYSQGNKLCFRKRQFILKGFYQEVFMGNSKLLRKFKKILEDNLKGFGILCRMVQEYFN